MTDKKAPDHSPVQTPDSTSEYTPESIRADARTEKKKQRLLSAIGDIDEKYIKEAENTCTPIPIAAGKSRYMKYGSLAACCVLLIAVGMTIRAMNIPKTSALSADTETLGGNTGSSPEDTSQEISAAAVTPFAASANGKAVPSGADKSLQTAEADISAAGDQTGTDTGSAAPANQTAAAENKAVAAENQTAAENQAAAAENNDAAGSPDTDGTAAVAAAAAASGDGTEESMEDSEMLRGAKIGGSAVANPFTECASLEEAAKLAGFDMTVPEAINHYTEKVIRCMPGDSTESGLIEVIFSDAAGTEGYRIRKAAGTDDISGDYNVYDTDRTTAVGTCQARLRGNGDTVSVATWTAGGFSYAIDAQDHPLTETDATALIRETL